MFQFSYIKGYLYSNESLFQALIEQWRYNFIMNRRAPKTDPCVTPDATAPLEELV